MLGHVTLSHKRPNEQDDTCRTKRLCFSKKNAANIGCDVYLKNRPASPPYHLSSGDSEDEEDDWSFYGVAKPCVRSIPISPPMFTSEDEEERDKQIQIARRRLSSNESKHRSGTDAGHLGVLRKSTGGCAKSHRRRKRNLVVPDSDLSARARCLDYLVGAIDEVWAQYCEIKSSAEAAEYQENDILPCSPVSLYEEDLDKPEGKDLDNMSKEPGSDQLMHLKERLLNSKYFFSELIDNPCWDASAKFWKRWDLVKYAAIDIAEDNDDDDVVEQVCEELEAGRAYHGA